MPTCVVVGNPKPQSRTLAAATLLMQELTGRPPDTVIDVITLGAGLLGWGDPGVAAAVATVKQADVLVVASPTYKATYTGLLKLFLDQFGAGSLDGALTYPLMLGAGLQQRWPRNSCSSRCWWRSAASARCRDCSCWIPTPR